LIFITVILLDKGYIHADIPLSGMKTQTILLVLVLALAQAQASRQALRAHPVFRGRAPESPEPERRERSWLLLLPPVLSVRLTARRQLR
jgi:hypothetical protein